MLKIENLEVVYQDVILVLRGISFEVNQGDIIALLGSNGSGKTTVLRSITGLLDVQNGDITKGKISFNNENISESPKFQPTIKIPEEIFIPDDFISDLDIRMSIYKRISNIRNNQELDSIITELIDRWVIFANNSPF